MRLATKFVLVFLAGTVTVLMVYGFFAVRRERDLFESDMERDTRLIGRSVRVAVSNAWMNQGEAAALQLVDDLDQEDSEVRVRWIPQEQFPTLLADLKLGDERSESFLKGVEISLRRRQDSEDVVSTYVPVEVAGELRGVLEVGESLRPADEYTRATIVSFATLAAAVVFLAALLGVPIGIRLVGTPLNRLVAKTRRAARGDFSGELQVDSEDELGELSRAMDSMCQDLARSHRRIQEESEARLAALEQLRHEDRLKTVGRLASGVAHELGTPLNVIGGRAGLIAKGDLDSSEVGDAARIIKQQADSMTAIVRQLLDFARRRAPDKSRVDLGPIVQQSLDLLRPMARKQGVDLRFNAAELSVVAEVDVGQFQQVIANLVLNSIQASPPGGEIQVTTRPVEGGSERHVCLAIEDEGEGISPEDLPHIFEPFFTTKGIGEGTGLGLSLVYGIVKEHGGRIEVSNLEDKGTRFEVHFPSEDRN